MEYPELVMGKCTRDHLAFVAGVTVGSLGAMISNDQLPPLPAPLYAMGGRFLYSEEDVEAYKKRVEDWRAEAPARNAARRAAIAARQQAELDRELTRMKQEQMLLRSGQEARDQWEADKAKWEEETKKGWGP